MDQKVKVWSRCGSRSPPPPPPPPQAPTSRISEQEEGGGGWREKFGNCPWKDRDGDEMIQFLRRSRGLTLSWSAVCWHSIRTTFIRMKMEVLFRMKTVGVVVLMLCLHHVSFSSAQVSPGDSDNRLRFVTLLLLTDARKFTSSEPRKFTESDQEHSVISSLQIHAD